MFTLNVGLFCYLFVFGDRVWGPGRFCRSSIFFFHWPAELLTSFVKHHRSDVQKKQDDTRQSSNGLQSRSPPPNVITELQTGLDLRNNILPGNNPDGLASCYCKFPVVFSLPVSSAVRSRVLWRKTIGAGTRVRLGFPNARPVVFDKRSEEFRRSVSSSNKREKNKIFCFSEQEKNRWNQRKPYRTVPGEPAWRYKIRNRNRKKKN